MALYSVLGWHPRGNRDTHLLNGELIIRLDLDLASLLECLLLDERDLSCAPPSDTVPLTYLAYNANASTKSGSVRERQDRERTILFISLSTSSSLSGRFAILSCSRVVDVGQRELVWLQAEHRVVNDGADRRGEHRLGSGGTCDTFCVTPTSLIAGALNRGT